MTSDRNTAERILTPLEVRKWLAHYLKEWEKDEPEISEGRRKAIVGDLNRALSAPNREPNRERRLLLGWVFCRADKAPQEFSSKLLSLAEWFALNRWTGSRKVGDRWSVRSTFPAEARWIANCALYDAGRVKENPALTMAEIEQFWQAHMYDINQDEDFFIAAMEIGGIPTAAITVTVARWVQLDQAGMAPPVAYGGREIIAVARDNTYPNEQPIRYILWFGDNKEPEALGVPGNTVLDTVRQPGELIDLAEIANEAPEMLPAVPLPRETENEHVPDW